MFARTHLGHISLVCVFLAVAFSLLASAQIHGVAPSVTSFGFGGSNNPTPGVAASVTSLGPNGFAGGPFIPMDCCFGPFFSPSPSLRFDGRRFHHHRQFPVGVMMPAFIPYPVPYAVPYDGYDVGDDYYADVDFTNSRGVYSHGVPAVYDRGPRYRDAAGTSHRVAEAPSARKEAESAVASDSTIAVAVQPATVLVYKDGHIAEVQNYAILGDTLFDFAGNLSHRIQLADLDLVATRKTNDDRGVDFQIPAPNASTP